MDAEIADDLRIAAEAGQMSSAAMAEFQEACRVMDWERADVARLRVVTLLEASMDAMVRANRRLEQVRGG